MAHNGDNYGHVMAMLKRSSASTTSMRPDQGAGMGSKVMEFMYADTPDRDSTSHSKYMIATKVSNGKNAQMKKNSLKYNQVLSDT